MTDGKQTRKESRTRTIVPPLPANGGEPCPYLYEERTVEQACAVTLPAPTILETGTQCRWRFQLTNSPDGTSGMDRPIAEGHHCLHRSRQLGFNGALCGDDALSHRRHDERIFIPTHETWEAGGADGVRDGDVRSAAVRIGGIPVGRAARRAMGNSIVVGAGLCCWRHYVPGCWCRHRCSPWRSVNACIARVFCRSWRG